MALNGVKSFLSSRIVSSKMHEMVLTVPMEKDGKNIDVSRITIRNLQKDGSLAHAGWVAYREVRQVQWLYTYGGWALEKSILRVLAKFQIMRIHYYNVDTGELLVSDLRTWRDHGSDVEFGSTDNVLLPDKYWRVDEKDYTTSRFIKNRHKTELLLQNLEKREAAQKRESAQTSD